MTLSGPTRGAASGETKSLLVLLHGYGADGNDLIGLAEPLAEFMPDTAFVAPNAPQRCRINPAGYQWFPIPAIDGSEEEAMRSGYVGAAEALDGWLAETIAAHGVGAENTAILGFSQGTMMALSVGPRRSPGPAAIVGFSGRVVDDGSLGLAAARPHVLLVHGDRDEVVPFPHMAEAEKVLTEHGFPVATFRAEGAGHEITPQGLGLAVGFLVDKLGITSGTTGVA